MLRGDGAARVAVCDAPWRERALSTTPSLREREPGERPGVTTVELFFDLVYVFAVVQLSRSLQEHLTVRGAVETFVLFLAVWWAWNYTAWATNWIK